VRCITGTYNVPYAEYPQIQYDFQIIIQTAKNGLRPTIPTNCPPLVASLLRSCWQPRAENRPSTQEMIDALTVLTAEYEAHQNEWDELCYQTSSNPSQLRMAATFPSPRLPGDEMAIAGMGGMTSGEHHSMSALIAAAEGGSLPVQTLTEEQQR
jgi:hypothetical protein